MMTKRKDIIDIGWNFDNSYLNLPKFLYSTLDLNLVPSPRLVVLNQPLARSLGLKAAELESSSGVAILAGNRLAEGSAPLAQAYAGHQFGHFSVLGDGRALLLGEQITPSGKRFDIQLKGSGITPYSRRGDGRATLGPMLREYIISEAMHALGIATSRSLAVVTTGESVRRNEVESGAILTRVSSSHLRVGTFQFASRFGSLNDLKALADYTILRHYPHLEFSEDRYIMFLKEVIMQQAHTIAKWQLVGFVHGVMNTDNMTVSGETIDYGPCAFMDAYHTKTVFSSIDTQGRYAYGNQPRMALWNLARFAESLLPLLHSQQARAIEIAQDTLADFSKLFQGNWLTGMRAKLGICGEEDQDQSLIDELLNIMQTEGADYTNTFIALTHGHSAEIAMFASPKFAAWQDLYVARLGRQAESKSEVEQLMLKSNPAIIPRNHRVEEALEAAVERGDLSVMQRLLEALAKPYAHSADQVIYSTLPPASDKPYRTYCGV